jgi:hypothetical protein
LEGGDAENAMESAGSDFDSRKRKNNALCLSEKVVWFDGCP